MTTRRGCRTGVTLTKVLKENGIAIFVRELERFAADLGYVGWVVRFKTGL